MRKFAQQVLSFSTIHGCQLCAMKSISTSKSEKNGKYYSNMRCYAYKSGMNFGKVEKGQFEMRVENV